MKYMADGGNPMVKSFSPGMLILPILTVHSLILVMSSWISGVGILSHCVSSLAWMFALEILAREFPWS